MNQRQDLKNWNSPPANSPVVWFRATETEPSAKFTKTGNETTLIERVKVCQKKIKFEQKGMLWSNSRSRNQIRIRKKKHYYRKRKMIDFEKRVREEIEMRKKGTWKWREGADLRNRKIDVRGEKAWCFVVTGNGVWVKHKLGLDNLQLWTRNDWGILCASYERININNSNTTQMFLFFALVTPLLGVIPTCDALFRLFLFAPFVLSFLFCCNHNNKTRNLLVYYYSRV